MWAYKYTYSLSFTVSDRELEHIISNDSRILIAI